MLPPGQSSLWAERRRSARCSLPGTDPTHRREGCVWRRAASHRPQTKSSLLGLAPGGGYLATHITARAGGLLHHLFTITTLRQLFVSVALIRQVHASSAVFPFTKNGISPPRGLSDAVLYGVRTFLDGDNAPPRSPNRPEARSSYTQAEGASTSGQN